MKYLYLLALIISCGATGYQNELVVTMDDVCYYREDGAYFRVDCGPNPSYILIQETEDGSTKSYYYPMVKYTVDKAVLLICEWDRDVRYCIRWVIPKGGITE